MVHTDSEYVIGAATAEWRPNQNIELVERLRMEVDRRPYLTFEHVRGHQGIMGNEIADALAGRARATLLPPKPPKVKPPRPPKAPKPPREPKPRKPARLTGKAALSYFIRTTQAKHKESHDGE